MRIGINGRHLGPNKTGVGRYLLSLLEIWAKNGRGHDFFVYYSSEKLLDEDKMVFKNSEHMHLRQLPRPLSTNSFVLWYNFTLPQALKKDKIDFFFSPDYFLPPGLADIYKSMSIHDVSYLAHPEWFPLLYRLYSHLYSKWASRRADIVFTLSQFSKQEIIKHMVLDQNRILVIPLAAHPKFRPGLVADDDLASLPIKGRFFLFVGKILNRRHVREMLEAFSLYLNESQDQTTQFVIRGQNETHPYININKIIEDINIKYKRQAIVKIDYIDDSGLVKLYQRTVGFFYLSTYEGFGLPVLEALACGAPTITVRQTSIPEVAGEAAIYVNPTDIKELSHTMSRLINDQRWAQELRGKALKQAQFFNWEKTAAKTLRTIEQIYGQ